MQMAAPRLTNGKKVRCFVSAEGLTSNPDNLHFNASSLYEFGLRYFKEFEKFSEQIKITDKEIKTDIKRSEMELL